MKELNPHSLALALRQDAQALAEALAAAPGLDPLIHGDTLKVAGAAQRFLKLWAQRSQVSTGTTDLEARQQRHDLRTPVSQALGYLELVQEGLGDLLSVCGDTASAPALNARMHDAQRLCAQVKALHASLESALGDFG